MKLLTYLLIVLQIAFIISKTISTNDLKSGISSASPGDIIELKEGTYSSIPYNLKSGKAASPIIIRASP